ncbi:hypothetical protein [Micromonospora sp. NPDC023737]|uniref:hypothetical protein n=1 Tax=unclassified Micromonospora TaxID=2617518 RepID=UPI0033D372B4
MGSDGRRLVALVLAAVTIVSGCGGPPPEKRSTAELLAIGQARLDEITIPAGWQLRGGRQGERSRGKLRWERDYRVDTDPDAAVRELDNRITAAGWTRRPKGSCLNSSGVACWTYDKGGLSIVQTALAGAVCPHDQPVCADVDMTMRQNFEEPI